MPPPPDVLVCVGASLPAEIPCERRIYYSHAAQLPVAGGWGLVVAVSEYHASLLRHCPALSPVQAITAGADGVAALSPRPLDRFLYASSPDRGLHQLLRMWPAFWRRFNLPLSITYDLRAVLARRGSGADPLAARLRDIAGLLDQPGVVVHGPLRDEQLAALRARSLAHLYPLDPVLPDSELLALSVLESGAAGVPLVLSPVDCLPSEYGAAACFVCDYEAESWVGAVAEVLADRERWADRARSHAASRDWQAWGAAWTSVVEGVPATPLPPRTEGAVAPVVVPPPFAWRPPELVP
ncbi:MAG: glycosyltransferase [Deltaproteobacteria bacterium]|nr:glycosyltransferase [Deltaproteobacteria bacterium]